MTPVLPTIANVLPMYDDFGVKGIHNDWSYALENAFYVYTW